MVAISLLFFLCLLPSYPENDKLGPVTETVKDPSRVTRGLILTLTLIGAALVLINIVIISCYVRRRNAKKKKRDRQHMKSNGEKIETNLSYCLLQANGADWCHLWLRGPSGL